MKRSNRYTPIFYSLILVIVIIAGGYYLIRNRIKETSAIILPKLSTRAHQGEKAFQSHCIACHGNNGTGTDKGPPLVNRIYAPSHHSDTSIARAVTLGARQHHWLFGDMPPLPQVNRKEIDLIIIYIRELQKANGIG